MMIVRIGGGKSQMAVIPTVVINMAERTKLDVGYLRWRLAMIARLC